MLMEWLVIEWLFSKQKSLATRIQYLNKAVSRLTLGKVRIRLFFLLQWVNNRADGAL